MKATLLGTAAVPPFPDITPPAAEPEAVSVDEAGRLLGLGRTKVYELIRDGVLPTVKLGRRRLVRPSTARQVLASLESTGIKRLENLVDRPGLRSAGEPSGANP